MEISLNLAVILDEICARNRLGGDALVLGEQNVGFGRAALERALRRGVNLPAKETLRQQDVFAALGLSSSTSFDLKERGANPFDLTLADTPLAFRDRFDLALNMSALEHVFHLPNALTHMTRMLKPGGSVIHVMPCNNRIDRGFYQFNPGFPFDYYRAANFAAVESILIAANLDDPREWFVHPLQEKNYSALEQRFEHCACSIVFMARAGGSPLDQPVPIERIDDDAAPPLARTRWFQPYRLNDGVTIRPRIIAEIDLQAAMQQERGFAWKVNVSDLVARSDSDAAPNCSTLIVLEDGFPIGPPHAPHAEIRAHGGGRYSHWGEDILFSTSDNSSPAETRRSYVAVLAEPVEETD